MIVSGGALRALLALAPLCCHYIARTSLNSECQLLHTLHSDMEPIRAGGGLTAGRSQPTKGPWSSGWRRLQAQACVRVLCMCWTAFECIL